MKNEHIVILLLVAVIAASYFGYIKLTPQGTTQAQQPQTPGIPYQPPTQSQTPSGTTNPDAQLYFEVTNAITASDVASTTDVDVAKSQNGVFNLLNAYDSIVQSANPQAMHSMIKDGSELIIHIASTVNPTGGAGYYDGWYYTIVHVGNPIYQMDYADFAPAATSPSYTYTVSQTALANDPIVNYVSWTSGTTPYWNLGKLYIFPRIATNATESISYQVTTLSHVSDGITWINMTTTEPTANATLASTNEQLSLSMYAANSNTGYGWPMMVVGSNGQILDYQTYVVFTTDMLAIGTSNLANSGWTPLQDSTLYAQKAFYKPIGPFFAPKGSTMNFAIPIPIDSSSAAKATKYEFEFWIIDMQNPTSIGIGTMTTGAPTAYGFITQYGLSACEQTYAYTTSSGKATQQQVTAFLTTPS
jgi:hypothetical protein